MFHYKSLRRRRWDLSELTDDYFGPNILANVFSLLGKINPTELQINIVGEIYVQTANTILMTNILQALELEKHEESKFSKKSECVDEYVSNAVIRKALAFCGEECSDEVWIKLHDQKVGFCVIVYLMLGGENVFT